MEPSKSQQVASLTPLRMQRIRLEVYRLLADRPDAELHDIPPASYAALTELSFPQVTEPLIVRGLQRGQPQRALARRYGVSKTFVEFVARRMSS